MVLNIQNVLRWKPWIGMVLLFAVLLVPLSTWTYLINSLNQPMAIKGDSTLFLVQPGSSLTRVANELQSSGHLRSSRSFIFYALVQGNAESIQSGEYELTAGITALEFLDKMIKGDTFQYRITLVEGWTLKQALDEIWSNPNIDRESTITGAESVATLLDLEVNWAEGMFYPDTYFFPKGTTDIDILRRANERMEQVLDEAWQSRLGALPYREPYDALIMASIIEKESAEGSERGHIAGVFVRRLELDMRLQSDPTVIYGMGDKFEGNIRREDILEETPYNTYRINGLPPTPIALAGIESIYASLNPIPSDYLYFVSRGDGTHYFSSTLEEHNAAVRRFQLQPR